MQRLKQEKREQADAQNRLLAVRRARRRPAATGGILPTGTGGFDETLWSATRPFVGRWTIDERMAEQGYDAEHVAAAILEASADLASRKSGHVEDYINRTVSKLYGQIGAER